MQPASASIATGGLLFALLRRIGVMSDGPLRPGRGIALVVLVTWVPLALLSAVEGTLLGGVTVPFLADPAVHARLLLALPMLIAADAVTAMSARRTITELAERRLLQPEDEPDLQAAVARLEAARDSRLAELVILVGTAVVLSVGRHTVIADRMAGLSSWMGGADGLSRAGWWYFTVSLYVSLVVGLRWVWWVIAWTRFVGGFLAKRLRVNPGHADGYAGLAFLTSTQSSLALVFMSLSTAIASRLGTQVLHEGLPIMQVVPPAAVVVVVALLAMFGPLVVFAPRVGRARRDALMGYDRLGEELTTGFASRWITGRTGDEPLLGGPDPSTLIDFAGAYEEVRKTKAIPFDPRRAGGAIAAVVVPFLPLVLTVMSAKDLLMRVVKLLM